MIDSGLGVSRLDGRVAAGRLRWWVQDVHVELCNVVENIWVYVAQEVSRRLASVRQSQCPFFTRFSLSVNH